MMALEYFYFIHSSPSCCYSHVLYCSSHIPLLSGYRSCSLTQRSPTFWGHGPAGGSELHVQGWGGDTPGRVWEACHTHRVCVCHTCTEGMSHEHARAQAWRPHVSATCPAASVTHMHAAVQRSVCAAQFQQAHGPALGCGPVVDDPRSNIFRGHLLFLHAMGLNLECYSDIRPSPDP